MKLFLLLTAMIVTPVPGSEYPHQGYELVIHSGLGGTSDAATSINDFGRLSGRSNKVGDEQRHAVTWVQHELTDLGTLGGPNSALPWPIKNAAGVLTGISQTSKRDPLGEEWSCAPFFPSATGTGYQCLGFRWQNGVMRSLPTLGGTHSYATGTNDSLMTVGWAELLVKDPTCTAPQQLQFRAVIWGKDGKIEQELHPLKGDPTSAATAINNRGQVVGISGECDQAVGRKSARSMVLWHGRSRISIPTFGGAAWNTPTAINAAGVVVGFANDSAASGTSFDPRAFLWQKGVGTRRLEMLKGYATSQASGINKRMEVVGQSCKVGGECVATRWVGGSVIDLNSLIKEKRYRLIAANDINDQGRIVGQALDLERKVYVAFSAHPISSEPLQEHVQ